MRTVWTLLTTASVATAICLLFADRPTHAQAPGAKGPYGVVDLGAVMENYEHIREMEEALQKRANDYKQEAEARRKKIEDIRYLRDQEHPDSPKWFELQKQLNRLTVELELWSKFEKQDIQADSREKQSQAYKQVMRAVETVAKQRGLDVVFRLDSIDLNDPSEVIRVERMTNRTVIYSSPSVDLTKEVIARVNQMSKSGK